MTRERMIVVGGHVVWLFLLVWTAVAPRGTFPNSLDPWVVGVPWIYLWLILLVLLWCLMLPAILRDSRIHSRVERGDSGVPPSLPS
jgi:hypothetical protein